MAAKALFFITDTELYKIFVDWAILSTTLAMSEKRLTCSQWFHAKSIYTPFLAVCEVLLD
jgi:hypothetical protein